MNSGVTRYATALSTLNAEPKSVLLLSIDEEPKSSPRLRRQWKEVLGTNVWLPEYRTIAAYCETMEKMGYVEEVQTVGDKVQSTVGWHITDEGQKYGQPVANFLLHKATSLGMSMQNILGQMQTPHEKRAPHTRAQIIEYLADGKTRTAGEVKAIYSNNSNSTANHLDALQEAGLIFYKSSKSRIDLKERWTGRPLNEVGSLGRFSAETCRTVAQVYSESISNGVDLNRDEAYDILQSKSIGLSPTTVRDISWRLQKSGFLTPIPEAQSKIKATVFGMAFDKNVLLPLRKFFDDKTVTEITELEKDPDSWSAAIDTYEPRHATEIGVHLNRLKKANEEIGRGIRPIEYAEINGLPKGTANALLNDLHDKGLVKRRHSRDASFYEP